MYHIIASDLDGTLLSKDNTLTKYTKKTIKNLLTKYNVHFVFATGRHHIDVAKIRKNIGIDAFMITSNGAYVHDVKNKLIFYKNIDYNISRELIFIKYHDKNFFTNFYSHNKWYINRTFFEKKILFRKSVLPYTIFNHNFCNKQLINKVFFICDDTKALLSLEKFIINKWGNKLSVSFSLPTCLEVMAGGVSKGKALKLVTKKLGYSLKECISFGDGMNDKEMLESTGKGCIMNNAHQRLKDILPQLEIIGNNIEDSVAHYLNNLF